MTNGASRDRTFMNVDEWLTNFDSFSRHPPGAACLQFTTAGAEPLRHQHQHYRLPGMLLRSRLERIVVGDGTRTMVVSCKQ